MTTQQEQEFGENITFFADWQNNENRRTGFNVQCVTTRRGDLSLALELAPIGRAGQAPDWARKITLHLSREELVGFCCVLLGQQEELTASFHGDKKNKGFTVRAKESMGAWIGLSDAGRQLQFLCTSEQRMSLCAFAVRRLAQVWKVPPSTVIKIIRSC